MLYTVVILIVHLLVVIKIKKKNTVCLYNVYSQDAGFLYYII